MPRLLRWRSATQAFIEPLGQNQTLTMVRIPAGRFLMGSPAHEFGRGEEEGPVHAVELQEFLMASTPITRAQWRAVAGWEPLPGEDEPLPWPGNPSLFPGEPARLGDGEGDSSLRPVEPISWEEAMAFCRRLSQRTGRHYTLPSEAQWEYACRAGGGAPYAFGSELTTELANLSLSTPVVRYPANAWGLHDMHGNVWEWCLDHWHDSYAGAPSDGSAWIEANAPATAERVLRGGGSLDAPVDGRSAHRGRLPALARVPALGFRVVCLPGPPPPALASPSRARPGRDRDGRQPLVLWLDDRPANHRGERAVLEAEGVTVMLASSPSEAIERLAAGPPVELLLSDLRQGDDPEAGLALLALLRAKTFNVPVIFYVGVLSEERSRKALDAGARAVISQGDQLLEAVRVLLAENRA